MLLACTETQNRQDGDQEAAASIADQSVHVRCMILMARGNWVLRQQLVASTDLATITKDLKGREILQLLRTEGQVSDPRIQSVIRMLILFAHLPVVSQLFTRTGMIDATIPRRRTALITYRHDMEEEPRVMAWDSAITFRKTKARTDTADIATHMTMSRLIGQRKGENCYLILMHHITTTDKNV